MATRKVHCTVTAILADGTRDSLTCEAASMYRAVFEYICSRLGNGLADRTTPDTVFEVQTAAGTYRTTRQKAWDWSNQKARQRSVQGEF